MIKKFIFSLAIILSLTTHHAVCMDNEDDELDIPTISARLAELDEQDRKEVERNIELSLKQQHSREWLLIGSAITTRESDNRLFKINIQRQKLIALLEKLAALPAPVA